MKGRVLRNGPSATAQSGNRFLSWPMRPSSSRAVCAAKRIGQADLIDHPDIQADIHPQHAEIGEKHCVRALLGLDVRRRIRRGRDRRHHVPLVVIAGRQQQGAVGGVVQRRHHRTHSRVIEIVGGGQWMRVARCLRVEPTLVDDAACTSRGWRRTPCRSNWPPTATNPRSTPTTRWWRRRTNSLRHGPFGCRRATPTESPRSVPACRTAASAAPGRA